MKDVEVDTINSRYEQLSVGVYPFISRSRVTVLKKGFYTKNKANYRGISFIYDEVKEAGKAILVGYIHVPHDCVIIPIGLELTEGKSGLIEDNVAKGYAKYNGFPSFRSYEFNEGSPEYEAAKLLNEKYKSLNKNDKINNI
tara:strand:+ start:155 stop:577 length:423 start_codon:yes stop_codon:yes gene_type:complete